MRYIYPGQHCQRYDQVKVKLEGQATAMMGVMLLNLGKEMFSNIKKNGENSQAGVMLVNPGNLLGNNSAQSRKTDECFPKLKNF